MRRHSVHAAFTSHEHSAASGLLASVLFCLLSHCQQQTADFNMQPFMFCLSRGTKFTVGWLRLAGAPKNASSMQAGSSGAASSRRTCQSELVSHAGIALQYGVLSSCAVVTRFSKHYLWSSLGFACSLFSTLLQVERIIFLFGKAIFWKAAHLAPACTWSGWNIALPASFVLQCCCRTAGGTARDYH